MPAADAVPLPPIQSETRSRATRWAAALFSALTLIATYPIASAPAAFSYFTHSDAQLVMWILAWDAHALARSPLNLFNANIFHPARNTLAYSETFLGYLPLSGPILWLRGSPALAFNVVLLFSFAASGFAMYLLARHLTGRHWPAVTAGVVYAFLPYRFVHVPQLQLEAMEWFPLSFLALHLFLEQGRRRHAWGLAAAVLFCAMCCVYYGVFNASALAVAMALLFVLDARARDARKLATLAVAAAGVALLVAPFVVMYTRVSQRSGFERSLTEISERSADWSSYTASGAPLHLALGLGKPAPPHDFLFPGFLALGLGVVGLAALRRRQVAWVYLAVGLFGWGASLGPDGLWGFSIFRPLFETVPVFRGLRQISRYGVLALFSLSVFAGFGCAVIENLWPRRRPVWQVVIATLVFLEVCPAPLRLDRPGGDVLMRIPDTPEVYRWIADRPGDFAILELPLPNPGVIWRNAPYVYWSTVHWHPLVNGYSGFVPPTYLQLRQLLQDFPDGLSRAALVARDVRYIVIHWERFGVGDRPIDAANLDRADWLRRVARFGEAEVFEIQPRLPAGTR
jgi:hypothetical protein